MNDFLGATAQRNDAAETILEAREDPRVGVDFPVHVFSKDISGSLRASARDMSVGGICVSTQSMFSFKSIYSVQMDLPGGALKLDAEGRWQSESPAEETRLTGIRFDSVPSESFSELWKVVNDAGRDLSLFLYANSDLTDLCPDDATNLAGNTRYRIVAPRRRIYRQGECQAGDSIFVVLRGEVSLMVQIGSRRESTLERLRAGGVFGGLPAVAGLPNQESAVADVATTLLEISRPCLSYLRVTKPLLAQRLMQIVMRNQLRRSHRMVEIASLSG